ncbi:MAG: hypothetical protein CVU41_02565 [Chloroflexi bacterium HGW-Chloroflexi-3]|nr:MAG: hypothetical protein CVU41_02565 [Chloroflexi bacterium HGW-Chloroflexi-3]
MNIPIDWLLAGEPWVAYRTRLDLLGEPETLPAVMKDRQAMLESEDVESVLTELMDWPGMVISSHKSAGQLFHKLTFIADLGFKATDPGMERIIPRILEHQSVEGPFQLPVNIPIHFGGNNQDTWAWALCDAPLTTYSLAKFGLQDEPSVRQSVDYLQNLVRDNGWPCAVSKELGKFRGPGRKEDPCPFATLAMLKAMSTFDDLRESPAAHTGVETLLHLWQESQTQHPYIFYMGTDFRKLKVPFVWYDLMHVLDVLSNFPWVRSDPRFLEMLELMKSKADEQGRFTLESIWTVWKGWDFGQKKVPSRWLTVMAWRVIKRVETQSLPGDYPGSD